jgi:DNA-binding NarL/FixJ family response regulator
MSMKKSSPDSAEPAVKVLIVDDHPAVREALAIRIRSEPDLEVCGEADDLEAALQVAAAAKPDLAVIDIALRTGSGIDLIKRLRTHDDQIRMIVWSMYGEELFAERALRAGAMGYLTKEKGTAQIIEAIRDVLAGNVYLSAGLTTKLLKRTVRQPVESAGRFSVDALSDRELEVFRLIGRGIKTQEIAIQLHLSVNTIETYRDRIRAKPDLTDGLELARCAMQWFLDNG